MCPYIKKAKTDKKLNINMLPKDKFEESEEKLTSKVYKKQKIKLYNIKHFIFDFGGVMVEKTFVLKNLFDIIEHDLKIRIPDKNESLYVKKVRRQATSGIISSRDFLKKLFEKYYHPFGPDTSSLPPKKPNIDYYLEIWFNLYSQLTDLSSELEEIIVRLRQAGYIVSLLSNTYDIHARSNLLKGFYEIFDNAFLSNEIGLLKPDLEKYKYVLKKLDTKPKKCIFIDDKIRNLVPARSLGMNIIKFESIENFKKLLNDLNIENINKNLRKEIRNKYKQYKLKKKEYKIAKKDFKEAKKDFLSKKKSSLKRKIKYQEKQAVYMKKKVEYKEERKKKKEELMTKIKIND